MTIKPGTLTILATFTPLAVMDAFVTQLNQVGETIVDRFLSGVTEYVVTRHQVSDKPGSPAFFTAWRAYVSGSVILLNIEAHYLDWDTTNRVGSGRLHTFNNSSAQYSSANAPGMQYLGATTSGTLAILRATSSSGASQTITGWMELRGISGWNDSLYPYIATFSLASNPHLGILQGNLNLNGPRMGQAAVPPAGSSTWRIMVQLGNLAMTVDPATNKHRWVNNFQAFGSTTGYFAQPSPEIIAAFGPITLHSLTPWADRIVVTAGSEEYLSMNAQVNGNHAMEILRVM